MTDHRPHTTHRPRTAAAIAALALVLLSGCARDQDGVSAPASSHHQLPPAPAEPTAPTAETTLPPAVATVDRTDPQHVAQAAVRIWFTWNTDVDTGPNNAAARTAPLLTPAFAHSVLATGSNNPGGQWLTWAQHKAIVTPTIRVLPDQGAPSQLTASTSSSRSPRPPALPPATKSMYRSPRRHGSSVSAPMIAGRSASSPNAKTPP